MIGVTFFIVSLCLGWSLSSIICCGLTFFFLHPLRSTSTHRLPFFLRFPHFPSLSIPSNHHQGKPKKARKTRKPENPYQTQTFRFSCTFLNEESRDKKSAKAVDICREPWVITGRCCYCRWSLGFLRPSVAHRHCLAATSLVGVIRKRKHIFIRPPVY